MINFYINFYNTTAPCTHTLQAKNDRLKKKYYLRKYFIAFLAIVYDCEMSVSEGINISDAAQYSHS